MAVDKAANFLLRDAEPFRYHPLPHALLGVHLPHLPVTLRVETWWLRLSPHGLHEINVETLQHFHNPNWNGRGKRESGTQKRPAFLRRRGASVCLK